MAMRSPLQITTRLLVDEVEEDSPDVSAIIDAPVEPDEKT
jgi:hypothetical protein